jgi:transposase-like protein
MRPSGSPEELERRRQRAIMLLQRGMAPVDVARHVGVDRRSVRRWRAGHDRAGPAGVAAKPAPGRPPKLDTRQRARLERLLRGGPRRRASAPPSGHVRGCLTSSGASSGCGTTSIILGGCCVPLA